MPTSRPWKTFRRTSKKHGYDFRKIPYVLQLNNPRIAMSVEDLKRELVRKSQPVI